MSMEENLTALVDAFDASWNAHDEEAIMDWFTEGAVVSMSPAPPGPTPIKARKRQAAGCAKRCRDSTLSPGTMERWGHGYLGCHDRH